MHSILFLCVSSLFSPTAQAICRSTRRIPNVFIQVFDFTEPVKTYALYARFFLSQTASISRQQYKSYIIFYIYDLYVQFSVGIHFISSSSLLSCTTAGTMKFLLYLLLTRQTTYRTIKCEKQNKCEILILPQKKTMKVNKN